MNEVFRPYLHRFVLVFFDDILVNSPTWEEHLEHLRQVLELLRYHKVVAKQSKCQIGQRSLDYLGHVISDQELSVDPAKISVIQQCHVPTNVKEVRSFLGLADASSITMLQLLVLLPTFCARIISVGHLRRKLLLTPSKASWDLHQC